MSLEVDFDHGMDSHAPEILCDDLDIGDEDSVLESETILFEISSLETRLKSIFAYDPKPEQVKAIYHLISPKTDVILIAKTGFGKSMVFQAVPILTGGICLMIVPLTALGEEQASKIQSLPNQSCKTIALKQENFDSKTLQQVREGCFTHVFMSPELAVSKTFRDKVLQDVEFREKLVLVGIDELHVAEEWKSWRPEYNKLSLLRARVGRSIPVFGTSATLAPSTLAAVKEAVAFSDTTYTLKTSIDRPEIYLEIGELKHTITSLEDLRILLSPLPHEPVDIPKSILYMGTIKDITRTTKVIRRWLCSAGFDKSTAWTTVQAFHSLASKYDRDAILEEFQKPDSKIRIIIATDAMGLGLDIPDVDRVFQWLLPDDLACIMQRAGRASRGKDKVGHFVWLVPPGYIQPVSSDRDVSRQNFNPNGRVNSQLCVVSTPYDSAEALPPLSSLPQPTVLRAQAKKDSMSRKEIPNGFADILNAERCIRKCLLEYFDDISLYCSDQAASERCCSTCHPHLALCGSVTQQPQLTSLDDSSTPFNADAYPDNRPPSCAKYYYYAIMEALVKWARRMTPDILGATYLSDKSTPFDVFLPISLIHSICRFGMHMTTVDRVRRWLPQWTWGEKYGQQLVDVINELKASKPTKQTAELSRIWLEQMEHITQRKKRKRQISDISPTLTSTPTSPATPRVTKRRRGSGSGTSLNELQRRRLSSVASKAMEQSQLVTPSSSQLSSLYDGEQSSQPLDHSSSIGYSNNLSSRVLDTDRASTLLHRASNQSQALVGGAGGLGEVGPRALDQRRQPLQEVRNCSTPQGGRAVRRSRQKL